MVLEENCVDNPGHLNSPPWQGGAGAVGMMAGLLGSTYYCQQYQFIGSISGLQHLAFSPAKAETEHSWFLTPENKITVRTANFFLTNLSESF
jgi:hypothetical protein